MYSDPSWFTNLDIHWSEAMNRCCFCTLLVTAALFGLNTNAEDAIHASTPEKEHEFLKRFIGDWETNVEALMGPEQPAVKCTGRIQGKMLGDLWIINTVKSQMGDVTVEGLQTIGYDPVQKKYIGTWVDSMMNHMWKYEGTVKGDEITLSAEGPSLEGDGKTTTYQDIYEFTSATEMKITSKAKTASGEWVTFMTGTAKRMSAK